MSWNTHCRGIFENIPRHNYDRQDYTQIKKEFPGVFETNYVYKYYYHGSNVYKYTFYNGGHLLIGLKQIEFVK